MSLHPLRTPKSLKVVLVCSGFKRKTKTIFLWEEGIIWGTTLPLSGSFNIYFNYKMFYKIKNLKFTVTDFSIFLLQWAPESNGNVNYLVLHVYISSLIEHPEAMISYKKSFIVSFPWGRNEGGYMPKRHCFTMKEMVKPGWVEGMVSLENLTSLNIHRSESRHY